MSSLYARSFEIWLPSPIALKEIGATSEKIASTNDKEMQENKIVKVTQYPYYKNY